VEESAVYRYLASLVKPFFGGEINLTLEISLSVWSFFTCSLCSPKRLPYAARRKFANFFRELRIQISTHGRGGRVGRDRGVGRDLGVALGVGVGLTLGDGVAVGVGVVLGVGVGVGTPSGITKA